jgi:hypothetical protein
MHNSNLLRRRFLGRSQLIPYDDDKHQNEQPPITPEVMPMMSQAFHAGMKMLRYFSDPMRMKMEADPINAITRANKTLTIIPVIRSLWSRFLRAASVSCRYALRTAFISLSNASMISLTSDN